MILFCMKIYLPLFLFVFFFEDTATEVGICTWVIAINWNTTRRLIGLGRWHHVRMTGLTWSIYRLSMKSASLVSYGYHQQLISQQMCEWLSINFENYLRNANLALKVTKLFRILRHSQLRQLTDWKIGTLTIKSLKTQNCWNRMLPWQLLWYSVNIVDGTIWDCQVPVVPRTRIKKILLLSVLCS